MSESLLHETAWFDSDWLAAREAADHAARNVDLTQRLSEWVRGRRLNQESYRVVDLGCGTGSNMRFLAPQLPDGQGWLLVDQDAAHLDAAERLCDGLPGVDSFTTLRLGIEREIVAAIPTDTDIVSGSALLDLVSAPWMAEMTERVAGMGAAALFTLSYSGDFAISPTLPDDALIRDAVNRHQRSEKGSGEALGPDAWLHCIRGFEDRGYRVFSAPSPWLLGRRQRDLQTQLFQGWAVAAAEQRPEMAARIDSWLAERLSLLTDSAAQAQVFHQDVLALPAAGDSDAA
ncbi:class I SAM-dependent methyltransferase [Marinobacter fonticola]|uniref:class I SAM-dependent methyltransferase n=1 Tax=Marinobacter fonticola TaxID=2603215 RepID=UPI0011E88335|nr:class I SAM-dependent methyltransferase [Marinobacter fonticola]